MRTQARTGVAMHKRATLIKATEHMLGQTLAALQRDIIVVYHPELAGFWVALGFARVKKNSFILSTVEGPFYGLQCAVACAPHRMVVSAVPCGRG